MSETQLMGERECERALIRIAHEIIERNDGADDIVLVGIPRRGVDIAAELSTYLSQAGVSHVHVGALDVTMYRDDLLSQPTRIPEPSVMPENIEGKTVIFVDDVLYTGRTIRAALQAINDYGRARTIQLAVLVDRGHRELPIRADYVGKNIPSSKSEKIWVKTQASDGVSGVWIGKKSK